MKLDFILNGQPVSLETPGDRRVVDLLREDLGLTGVKEACGAGECGACTVLVEGQARLSCLMLAAQLEGRACTTIEGLSQDGRPHPIQEAFARTRAVQCGFCTPGMVLAAHELLDANPRPSPDQIRQGLSGNLCRCTGYQGVVEAVELAAARMNKGEA